MQLDHPIHLETIIMKIWNRWLEGLISRRDRNFMLIKVIAEDEIREYNQEMDRC